MGGAASRRSSFESRPFWLSPGTAVTVAAAASYRCTGSSSRRAREPTGDTVEVSSPARRGRRRLGGRRSTLTVGVPPSYCTRRSSCAASIAVPISLRPSATARRGRVSPKAASAAEAAWAKHSVKSPQVSAAAGGAEGHRHQQPPSHPARRTPVSGAHRAMATTAPNPRTPHVFASSARPERPRPRPAPSSPGPRRAVVVIVPALGRSTPTGVHRLRRASASRHGAWQTLGVPHSCREGYVVRDLLRVHKCAL